MELTEPGRWPATFRVLRCLVVTMKRSLSISGFLLVVLVVLWFVHRRSSPSGGTVVHFMSGTNEILSVRMNTNEFNFRERLAVPVGASNRPPQQPAETPR